MKRLSLWILALLMALSLCACGSSGQPTLGTYTCTSMVMNDMDLGSSGEWIQLDEDGRAVVYISGESRHAEYTLEEEAFTLTMEGQTVGTGTLGEGRLTLDYMGMVWTFALTEESNG